MKLGIKTESIRVGLLIALIFSMRYHGFDRILDEISTQQNIKMLNKKNYLNGLKHIHHQMQFLWEKCQ